MSAERTPQPCGGKTGYGCGKPVLPGSWRRAGSTWWHLNEDCQRAHSAWRKQVTRERVGGTRVRLTREGEGIYRIRIADTLVGWVVSYADGWTARLQADSRWAWSAPFRRQAVDGLVRHLEESK